MKKLVLTLAVALFAICSASANNYVANEAAIDAIVENSVEMVMEAAPAAPALVKLTNGSTNPLIATALAWFTGWCGLHRYYLGTEVWMAAPYLITCGVLGWIDAVVFTLEYVQNNTISGKYSNNPKIILWADLF